MAARTVKKATSLSKTRTSARTGRLMDAAKHSLDLCKESGHEWVRWHRLVHGCDPDLDDIPNDWPSMVLFIEEED